MSSSSNDDYVDEAEKRFLHDYLGFNLLSVHSNKKPILAGSNIVRPQEPLTESVLRAPNYGIVHTTNTVKRYVLVDIDKPGIIPDKYRDKIMRCVYKVRRKWDADTGEWKNSYHGIFEITDKCTQTQIKEITREFTKAGVLELFFLGPRYMAWGGSYDNNSGGGGGDDGSSTSKWHFLNAVKEDNFKRGEFPKCTLPDLQSLMSGIYRSAGITVKSTTTTTGRLSSDDDDNNNNQNNTPEKSSNDGRWLPNGEVNIWYIPEVGEADIVFLGIAGKLAGEDNGVQEIFTHLMGLNAQRPGGMHDVEETMQCAVYCVEKEKAKQGAVLLSSADEGRKYIQEHEHFAHIVSGDEKDQWNLAMWDGNQWVGGVASRILGILRSLNIESDKWITSKACVEMAKQISTDTVKTLQVVIDDKYQAHRARKVFDLYGDYWDIPTGKVCRVDPKVDFFVEPDVKLRLDESLLLDDSQRAKYTELFYDFLKARCGKDWKVVRDFKAGIFLHNRDKGYKGRALTYIGPHNAYKSLVIEITLDYVNSAVSMSQASIGNDNFALSTLGNKMYCASEEVRVEQPRNPDVVKDVITATAKRSVRTMHTTETKDVWRYPTCEFAGNDLAPMGADEDLGASHIRNQYIEMCDVESNEPDWRAELSGKTQGIMMLLLSRATELYNKTGEPFNEQSFETVSMMYDKLTTGRMKEAMLRTFEYDPNVCVSWVEFHSKMKLATGKHITKTTLGDALPVLGLERDRRHVEASPSGRAHEYHISTNQWSSSLEVVIGVRFKPTKKQIEKGIRQEMRDMRAAEHREKGVLRDLGIR